MPRSVFNGYLKVALVIAPVSVYKGREEIKSNLHLVHGPCNARINQFMKCQACGDIVERSSLIRGIDVIEVMDGKAVTKVIPIQPEELEQFENSEKGIEVIEFVPRGSIPTDRYNGDLYFISPEKDKPEEPYVIIYQTLIKTKSWAIAKFNSSGREELVVITPNQEAGLLYMYGLFFDSELRDTSEIRKPDGKVRFSIERSHLNLAEELFKSMTINGELDLSEYKNEYEDKLKNHVNKLVEVSREVENESRITDLMERLKESLNKTKGKKKKVA